MSKHSHWAKIKHGKGAADVKRGMIFTKLARVITVAARAKGPDPNFNFKLRLAIDQARAANMPRENIERAVSRATGDGGGTALEELLYEAIVPGGIGIVIEATSDNKNRTTGEVKKILSEYGGSLAAAGAVRWNFNNVGVIRLQANQFLVGNDLELKLIEAGAEDIKAEDGETVIYVKPENFEQVKNFLEKDNIKIDFAGLEWIARDKIKIEDAEMRGKLEQLFEALEESEEVDEYFTNLVN